MATSMTLKACLEILLTMRGAFVLQNDHGSMEFRGTDLYVRPYNEWLTIYHAEAKEPESYSHVHLKWPTIRSAAITHETGQTPLLAFYGTAEPEGTPRLIWYFPSFYDWGNGKAEIPANIAQYEQFVARYGRALAFGDPADGA